MAADLDFNSALTRYFNLALTGLAPVGSQPGTGTNATTAPTVSQQIAGVMEATNTYTTGQLVPFHLGAKGSVNVTLKQTDSVSDIFVNTTGADGASNASSGPIIHNRLNLYNGTTWDRAREITGTDGTGLGVQAVEQAGALFNNITTATTTTVKSGTGTFHKLLVNTIVASATITIYNSLTATGAKIATITLPATAGNPFELDFDLWFSIGLTVLTSGASDITVIYR